MKTFWLAPAFALLAACATTPSDTTPTVRTSAAESARTANRRMVRTSDCVFHSSIDGFNVLDERYVILYGSGGRHAYLAEISGACFNLKSRPTLVAVDGDDNGQICGFGRDSIAYHEFGRLEQCRILSLEQLSDIRRYEVLGEGPPTPRDSGKKDKDKKDQKDEQDDDSE